MKILVVEDEPFSREVVARVLRKWGHEVTSVPDGLAAWESLQQADAPQVAILDQMMPGLDGLELCRRLRARKGAPALYLIMLTGVRREGSMVEALEAGADDFIHKPFNPLELQARLGVARRMMELYNRLDQKLEDLRAVLRERDNAEQSLRQSEHYLKMVMAAVPAGVLVCDDTTGRITDANPVAERWLGLPSSELRRESYHRFFRNCRGKVWEPVSSDEAGADCQSISAQGLKFHVRLTHADACIGERNLRLLSFLDVSDTQRLLEQQQLNLGLARNLLQLVNSGVPRWIGLNEEATLHLAFSSENSQQAGGDHFWARTLAARGGRGPVTVVALRDQSGHEVNCILRSIATDLMHREGLERGLSLPEQILLLNHRLRSSNLFAEDEFLTGLTLELEHSSLRLRYVSCGHPPMLLLRGTEVIPLPANNSRGANLPLGIVEMNSVEVGECQLQTGDRLVLYTDGLFELGKPHGRELLNADKLELIIKRLLQASPDLPVSQLIPQLLREARGGCEQAEGCPPDDTTILGLEIEADGGSHELVLHPADIHELDASITEIHKRALSDWQVTQAEWALGLRLILDEALSNGWFHGNKQNPALPIRVRWGRRNGYSLEVEDAGSGFEPLQAADPRSPERLLEERGRGLFLMQRCCEWLEWKKKGARLVARVAFPPPLLWT